MQKKKIRSEKEKEKKVRWSLQQDLIEEIQKPQIN